ncbi:MAG: radical SAM protein [Thermodesulfobacteriota bacterium]|nr:radical SAM protein [Thermodesulfobacteriota bacterium]
MQCTQTTWLSNQAYLQQFNQRVIEDRIPLFGSIDLTYQCNLQCVHCYVGDKTGVRENRGKELSAAQWVALIDDVVEAGCLYLLITGGEPLFRKDFPDIYRYAKEKGLLVTVFSNGTLVTDEIVALFEDLPPHAVDISVYGATASTYEKVTGRKGFYERCVKGIETLLDHGVHVTLKTVVLTLNQHEFFDIERMARAYGVRFRFDPAIFPCLDGDKTPLAFRVAPEEAMAMELSDEERREQWRAFFDRFGGVPTREGLYQCGAGVSMFHIDPYGCLRPCVMVRSPQYDLVTGSFLRGWNGVISAILDKKAGPDNPCRQCEKRTLCGYCPGFFDLENGSEGEPCAFFCAMGDCRLEAIQH